MLSIIKRSWSGAASFFSGTVQELKKVRWPTRREMINYTLVVMVTVIICTIFIFIVDLGIGQMIRKLLSNKAA